MKWRRSRSVFPRRKHAVAAVACGASRESTYASRVDGAVPRPRAARVNALKKVPWPLPIIDEATHQEERGALENC